MRHLGDRRGWFLIDWEDAAVPPTTTPKHFSRNGHSPKIFSNGHGAEVDIWGVGELIVDCGALDISAELRNLGQQMQASTGFSAQYALENIKSYQTRNHV